MRNFMLIRLEAPLQAWGDVAVDRVRPTRAFPSCSALAGLLANALGWTYRDGERTTALQDSLRYAIREDRPAERQQDYHTADLGRIGSEGWTRWGIERRGGQFSDGTHILNKVYLADASFLVALTLRDASAVALDQLEDALKRPARPLFLGRKCCPPALPLAEGRVHAENAFEALRCAPLPDSCRDRLRMTGRAYVRVWYEPGDGPVHDPLRERDVWDRRDFAIQRFAGSRRIVEAELPIDQIAPSEALT